MTNADEVLDTLSDYQETLGWLSNDGRQHLVDARLSVFRSDEHFAVFIEFPHFLYGSDSFENWVGCAGDCLVDEDYPLFSEELAIEEVAASPLWSENGDWIVDRSHFSVLVSGKQYDFTPSPLDYEKAVITFKDERSGVNTISTGQLLRFLCIALDHPFFRSEKELRTLISPPLEPQMTLFLRTNWWHHPKFLAFGNETFAQPYLLKNIPCWQILARAIASGDLGEWSTQDTSTFNTDWPNLERIYREGNSTGYGFD